jgi:hypothetical protein
MKIKLLKSIGIEGSFPKVGEVVEVPDRFGREMIHRNAAELALPRRDSPEDDSVKKAKIPDAPKK